jgi:hypothetical protein
MDLDELLTYCRIADGRLVDIGIAHQRIVARDGPVLPAPAPVA